MKKEKAKFLAKKMGMEDKDMGYAEEEEKETEDYSMPIKEAVKEHERLVKILRTGSKAELLKEADAQEKELKEKILGGKEEKDEGYKK